MTNKKDAPIGVFDSGMGGISVLRELVKIMPNEDYIFFGDSANAPYGIKTVEEVQKLSFEKVEHLLSYNCKAIVVACNTATSAAIKELRAAYPDLIIVGLEPALKPAVEHKKDSKVGVMATPLTLKEKKFNTIDILFNNIYELENCIVAGTRGWDYTKTNERKIIEREIGRLELSLKDAKKKNEDKEIVVCMYYPPISKNYLENEFERKIIYLLKEYNVKKCIYGHLHGTAHSQAITGIKEGIEFSLVSADYLEFKLLKIY